MTGLIFYLLAAMTVLSGFFVVFSRNIVHAGFGLLFTLFGVAGLYGMLGADFLAVTQVIVYIGGILVLVLFTVMMTRIPRGPGGARGHDRFVPAGILALLLFALLYKVITGTPWALRAPEEAVGTTARIGLAFLTDYVFPFEFASLVLLVAMIGAAILIRERRAGAAAAEAGERAVAGGAGGGVAGVPGGPGAPGGQGGGSGGGAGKEARP